MRISENNWLKIKPIAHRGLWGDKIKENSLTAYKNAAAKGFPIEIDVYLSSDGEIFSFHDSKLKRMTDVEGFIYEKSSEELKQLRLKESDEPIPTLEQVLSIAEGKSPLLIEIKDQPDKSIVDKLIARLKNYEGEFAIQSFNPLYMIRVKKLAPEFIRGVLTDPRLKNYTPLKRFIIRRMPFNFIIKPDFIACRYNYLNLVKRKAKNKVLLAWTVTSTEIKDEIKGKCDNIIFEHFRP